MEASKEMKEKIQKAYLSAVLVALFLTAIATGVFWFMGVFNNTTIFKGLSLVLLEFLLSFFVISLPFASVEVDRIKKEYIDGYKPQNESTMEMRVMSAVAIILFALLIFK